MGRLIDTDELREHQFHGCYTNIHTASSTESYMLGWNDAIDAVIAMASKGHGTYECFHCLSQGVIWDADFDFEDFGYEGEGIVHICHCANCGAEIEYRIPLGEVEEDE